MQESRFVVIEGSRLEDSASLLSEDRYTFFSHTLCPYAERVWLTLLEKGCAFTMVHVDLSNKPDWYYGVNPRGLVPAVSHRGNVMTESMDLCRWLSGEDTHDDALLSSAVSSCLDAMSGSNARFWGIGTKIRPSQIEGLESSLGALFSDQAGRDGPFLFGEQQATLSDFVVYPFVQRAQVAMKDSYGVDVGLLCDGSVGVWMDAMTQLSSVRIASADESLLKEAFRKHKSLDFFDYTSYGPYDLHPHLVQYASPE
ncbi:hypothetical protein M9435_000505 [Picochlorum sp. BPE23]|nr:hypothetical protein M9435_000505 [Picochlorum sp. BPE23]